MPHRFSNATISPVIITSAKTEAIPMGGNEAGLTLLIRHPQIA
jgi:hypothetical protein